MTDDETTAEVYFNSACPVCNGGIRRQKHRLERAGVGRLLAWRDIGAEPAAVADLRVDIEAVRRKLYAVDRGGKILVGVDAFALMWRATPGWRWLGALVSLPVVHVLATWGYDAFAALLYAWNRKNRRW